jgi:hypothetical protein
MRNTAAPVGLLAGHPVKVPVASTSGALWSLLSVLMLWQIGAHVDAWYHVHYGATIDSFLTWPHALLYAGWASTAAVALVQVASRGGWGTVRSRDGLLVVVLGVTGFGLGGLVDFAWHTLVGFETNIETVFAPSHLWLLVWFMVAGVGTLRIAADQRRRGPRTGEHSRAAEVALMICIAILFRATIWSLFYAAPLAVDYAASGATVGQLPGYDHLAWVNDAARAAGTTGMLLYGVLLALFVVLAVHRLRLPAGCLAVLMLWDGLLTALATGMWLYVPAVALAATVSETFWAWLRRSGADDEHIVALATSVPMALLIAYFGTMAAFGGGIRWSAHVWVGSIGLVGLFSLVAGLIAEPPRWLASR